MYSKALNGHSQKYQKLIFKTNYRLNQVKNIAECSKGIILQYFRSYHLSLRYLFCLFLSGRFRQVLLSCITKQEPKPAQIIGSTLFNESTTREAPI